MDFSIFEVWLRYLLLTMGGCLIISFFLLFISNKNIKKKLDKIEQND
jgi:hypothetical protein